MSDHACKQLFYLINTKYRDFLLAIIRTITHVAIYPTAKINLKLSHPLVTKGALACGAICRVGVVKLLSSIVNFSNGKLYDE
jgi:hypothetical protein